MLLDLSSSACSESVMFLSRTGVGGVQTRLTKAMEVGSGAGLLRHKSEEWVALSQSRRRWFGRDAERSSVWKKLTVTVTCLDRDNKQTSPHVNVVLTQ